MDITHYTFTLYVFLLVCAAIWLFGRVMRKSKKEDKNGYEKEQRLFKLYQNVEDMLGMFEEYAEEAKKEIETKLKEARELLENAGRQPNGESAGGEWMTPAMVAPSASVRLLTSLPKNRRAASAIA